MATTSEAVLVIWPSMPEQPDGGDPGDIPLLAPADRFDGRPTAAGAPGLHLHEGHCIPLPDHEIEIVAAQLESVRLDRPAAGGKKPDGDLLAAEAEELALIFPFGGWNEAAGARHATR